MVLLLVLLVNALLCGGGRQWRRTLELVLHGVLLALRCLVASWSHTAGCLLLIAYITRRYAGSTSQYLTASVGRRGDRAGHRGRYLSGWL
uniref:Putative secreted protein n=1 Tax=Anopheles triannulatus TaxID=58253 RepID=A0A2M4B1M0_9DIPT